MAYLAQIITVPDGGTGVATLTSHGVLLGAGTGNVAATAAGSAGQVLQSGGASANPLYSTATYPATAGTSGNVLTSDGTNWNSTAAANSSSIVTVTGQLTSAQIKALHGTPIQIVAAPGANKYISIVKWSASYVYGGSNVFTAGAAQTIAIYFGTTTSYSTAVTNASLVATNSTLTALGPPVFNTVTTSLYANTAVNWYNSVATEISGNAGNDNVVNWSVSYIVTAT